MIWLHRINGTEIMVNSDHIRFIERCPDTVVTFNDGKTLMVKESPEEIFEKLNAIQHEVVECKSQVSSV